MIKHIVVWKLKDLAEGKTKAENLILLKQELESLSEKIQEVKHLEVGINFNPSAAAFDIALYSEFESKETLEKYLNHPEHQKIVELVGKLKEDRFVVDYEI